MKTTITFNTDSTDKIQLLLKVAHEMGISTSSDSLLAQDKDTKETKTTSFQQLLLQGPVMSEEDYQFYLKKKSYFNEWNKN